MSIGPAPSAPDLVKYQLLDEIGHGGMATVYRARDVRLGREVAIKLIHPHLRENKEVAARFVTEARAVAMLRHPGIVEVFDVSEPDDAERFLVSELIRGPSLRALLNEHHDMPPEIGACFGALLCDALAHAHAAGIVHRDVKPENVLVELDPASGRAQVKLTDFGIAKVLDAQGVTSTGQVLGSPAHMAPEQIEGGQVDVRADVFSLGVLVYECMVGHLPFVGKNPAQVLRKVLDCSYQPADVARAAVGSRWSSLLAKAIAREPADRYPSIEQFGAAIRAELQEVGLQDPRAEIGRCLADPEAYAAALEPRLLEALVARARRARSRGDVQAAAADLNRAVAYAPHDAELLRLVAALARGQQRRRLAKRLGVAMLFSSLLGASAFGVVRYARRARAVSAPPVASSAVAALPSAESPRASSSPSPSASTARAPDAAAPLHIVALPRVVASGVPPRSDSERDVEIFARPMSARVSVDGAPAVDVAFGLRRRLAVGSHSFAFSVGPSNRCCEPKTTVEEIKPDDGSGPQRVAVSLAFRPATLALVGAPSDGRLRCPMISADVGAGGEMAVPMGEGERTVNCFYVGGGGPSAQAKVTLRAGEPTVVRWPAQ